jgi:hypothetical protein
MHETSYEKMRAFRSSYLSSAPEGARLLDVGSCCLRGSLTYRSLFSPPAFDYTGLDIAAGHNVDLIAADPFSWDLPSESFDVVISGQMFEHNAYPWITMAEIARITTQGGLIAIIAPSGGQSHRVPFDCWRFYPDSWAALCTYVGLELLETHREKRSWRKTVPGVIWCDAMMIARKPAFADDAARQCFYDRLKSIFATRCCSPERHPRNRVIGPAGLLYEQTHTLDMRKVIWRPSCLGRLAVLERDRVLRNPRVSALHRRLRNRDGGRALGRGEMLMPFTRDPEELDAAAPRQQMPPLPR